MCLTKDFLEPQGVRFRYDLYRTSDSHSSLCSYTSAIQFNYLPYALADLYETF